MEQIVPPGFGAFNLAGLLQAVLNNITQSFNDDPLIVRNQYLQHGSVFSF